MFVTTAGTVRRNKLSDFVGIRQNGKIAMKLEEGDRIVGCSREMAGRVLKALAEQGHISVKGKTIVVFGTR